MGSFDFHFRSVIDYHILTLVSDYLLTLSFIVTMKTLSNDRLLLMNNRNLLLYDWDSFFSITDLIKFLGFCLIVVLLVLFNTKRNVLLSWLKRNDLLNSVHMLFLANSRFDDSWILDKDIRDNQIGLLILLLCSQHRVDCSCRTMTHNQCFFCKFFSVFHLLFLNFLYFFFLFLLLFHEILFLFFSFLFFFF